MRNFIICDEFRVVVVVVVICIVLSAVNGLKRPLGHLLYLGLLQDGYASMVRVLIGSSKCFIFFILAYLGS